MFAFPSPVERRSIISEARDLAWPGMKYTLQDLQINNTYFDLPFQLNLQTSCTYQCQALGTPGGRKVVFHAGVKSPTSSPPPLCCT